MDQIYNRNLYWLQKLDFLGASTRLTLLPMLFDPSSFEGGCTSANLPEQRL